MLIPGVIGNAINIVIFSSTHTYRKTPASFFFLIGSIASLLHLSLSLTSRILSIGYGIDTAGGSLVVCKIRSHLIPTLPLFSFTCTCLASIDQFLSTSRYPSLRRFSHIKCAHRALVTMTIIWCLHDIPYLIYYQIPSPSQTCTNINPNFRNYTTYSLLIFVFVTPVLVLTVFGYLSYRNIHQIQVFVRERADRQLTKMIFMQTALVCFSVIPYGVVSVYSLITVGIAKDTNQVMNEYLLVAIVNLISYVHFAVCLVRILNRFLYLFF